MLRDRDYVVGVQAARRSGAQSQLRGPGPAARGTLEVGAFTPRHRSTLAESRVLVGAGCAALSTLLHLALLTSAILPSTREKVRPRQYEGMPTSRIQTTDEMTLQWVNLEDRVTADSSLASRSVLPAPRLIRIAVTAPLPELAANFAEAGPKEAHTTVANDSDSSSLIYERFLGQIDARIDRAWMRPRTPIGANMFLCHVRIQQDASGRVKEIELEQCNGTALWQRSLIEAIESASPLPAPADPAVFAPVIKMTFHAEASDEELTASEFAPRDAVERPIQPASVDTSLVALREIRGGKVDAGATSRDLRIEGRANSGEPRSSTRDRKPLSGSKRD
jgi:TonB C terminal